MADGGKITINGDELLQKHEEWAKGEGSDASNSGKRREAIGAYAEKCGIENKALSQFRAGMKIKNDGKRKDWLRSMQLLLPVAEREIFDNDPDLPLDNPNEDVQQEAAEQAASEANDIAEEHGVGDPGDETPETTDAETEEFNNEVDEVMGYDVVTPISFGGEAAE